MSEMVKLDAAGDWTGLGELPFEVIAERELELEHDGQKGPLLVTFAKPTYVEGKAGRVSSAWRAWGGYM